MDSTSLCVGRLAVSPSDAKPQHGELDEIRTHLFLGNALAMAPEKWDELQEKKIARVLCCAGGCAFCQTASKSPFEIKPLSSAQLEEALHNIEPTWGWMHEVIDCKRGVFVHCQQGINRSAALMVAYLMRDEELTYDRAFAEVQKRRSSIDVCSTYAYILRKLGQHC